MKKYIILFIYVCCNSNLFGQFGEIGIADKVFNVSYDNIRYYFEFTLEKPLLQRLQISKGAILSTKEDTIQVTLICDIIPDEIIADKIEDKGEFWAFSFDTLNKKYKLSFKTFCLERGKAMPKQDQNSSTLPSITTGQKIPYDIFKKLKCNREKIHKHNEQQGTPTRNAICDTFSHQGSWEETLKLLVKQKILEEIFNFKEEIEIDCKEVIDNNGNITPEKTVYVKKSNTEKVLYTIKLIQHREPDSYGNTKSLYKIEWHIYRKG